MSAQKLPFTNIQSEIASGNPVGCRVGWFGPDNATLDGSGHFMVVVGWIVGSTGTRYINIADPIFLDQQAEYDDFANSYQGGGIWTHTYFTQRPHAPLGGGPPVLGVSAKLEGVDRESIGA